MAWKGEESRKGEWQEVERNSKLLFFIFHGFHVQVLPPLSMHLDRVSSPTESVIQQRREAAIQGAVEGIEVASSIRPYDTSSTSYLGSIAGSDIQDYYSSSQPPNEMYESSDYRVSPTVLPH